MKKFPHGMSYFVLVVVDNHIFSFWGQNECFAFRGHFTPKPPKNGRGLGFSSYIRNWVKIAIIQPFINWTLWNCDGFPALYELAQDYVSAPASQAYSERVFSLCGDLSNGKRNRVSVALQKRVFLKMNKFYFWFKHGWFYLKLIESMTVT